MKIVSIFFLFLSIAKAEFYLSNEMKDSLEKSYSQEAVTRALLLVDLMNELEGKSLKTRLIKVNNFFNDMPYRSDKKLWNRSDYWANRMEFIGKGAGDCEDYAFAKYFTLVQLGIDRKQLRAFYCKSLTYNQAHMVLAFFSPKKRVPFILGNYNYKILPSTQRKDLKPIKVYNSDDLFLAKLKKLGKKVPKSKAAALDWLEFLNGIRKR